MQSASHLNSHSRLHQYPWHHRKTPRFRSSIDQSNSVRPNLSLPPKNPTFSKLSKLSRRFKLEEIEGCEGRSLLPLPVVVHRAGKSSRYLWDGAHLRLEGFDREPADGFRFGDEFQRLFQMLGEAIRHLFVPRQVQDNYMGYLKWKVLHRVSSSALQVLATQAMFRAIGFGSSHSLPSAAALNWVLKDGLGRLSRCIYTASLGSAFDTNLKRVRFSTSVLFSLGIGIELLTPAFPQYFLLLATVANIAKSISLAAYLATGTAIHRSFAITDNLGEVSAKSQIQTVCFDNLGLLLAALLNILCKINQRFQAGLPLIYPIFAAVDLFAIYQGLKFVHLQTLTKDRLEIIINTWLCSGVVPSPAEVSSKEGIDVLMNKGSKLWPIRIGCLDPKDSFSMVSVLTIQSLRHEDLYFICMEISQKGLTRKQPGILLSLQETAVSSDIIIGLLQACLIRKMLLPRSSSICNASSTEDSMLAEWFKVVEDSKLRAIRESTHLIEELQRAGWVVKNILLNFQEQIRYSLVREDSYTRIH
ncbi:protein root UVB sensitive 4 isoform X1 [Phoenix dactylifera]|uniref:Protein root UVB sensitive 4 isoform X1 n=1 Tax=Phoenix dactylifera TaxID=42345 RepID=A0A8B7C2R9_PHODC|nr:protein root UVB sensitive 4 isoform X1 [Phoenix dactylifera]